jgi:hypothetical protein
VSDVLSAARRSWPFFLIRILRWTVFGLVTILILAFVGSFIYVNSAHVAARLVFPKQSVASLPSNRGLQ